MSSQGLRASRMLLAASFALGGSALSFAAHSYQPGWYFGVQGQSVQVEDSDGESVLRSTTVGQSSTPQPCPVAPPPGPVGDVLSRQPGCLANLIGPGTTVTEDNTTTTTFPAQRSRVTFDGGFGLEAQLGYLFEGGLRPEISLAYAESDVERFTTTGISSSSGSLETASLLANVWYDIDFGQRFIPYIGVGAGYQRASFDIEGSSDDSSGFLYQGGAGIGFLLTEQMTLSLDYRYAVGDEFSGHFSRQAENEPATTNRLDSDQDYEAQHIGLGIRYAFAYGGGRDSDGDGVPDRLDKCPNTPQGVQVYSNGCPVDLDGDGVPDYLDKCPGTPKGTPVDANGCPADSDGDGVPDHLDKCPSTARGVMVGPDGCPIDSDGDGVPDAYDKCPDTARGTIVGPDGCPAADSDGDGVPDFADKCPNTPKGVAVGADGCPLDSDGDGIPDYLDECPNSPPGAKVLPNGCALVGDCRRPRPGEAVDANGCALDKNFILRGVKFEFDSDRLTEPAKQILNEVAETLKAYPTINVDLEGHTDNVGTDAYNLGLSERRANAVKVYLSGKGVDAPRMNPVGYGESRPIDSNETDDGRENNRRVELKVIE